MGPLLPLRSTISHPPPQCGALHLVQKPVTYLQPAADGPAQDLPVPTGASQPCPGPWAAGGTGRRALEAELRLGALPPDSLGPPSLCCLCSTQHTHAHTVVHTCTDTLIHPHIHTYSYMHMPADTYMLTDTEHTITPTCTLTPSYKYTCILTPAQLKHTHTHMLTHTYACTHSCTHTHALARTRMYPHARTLTGHSSCPMEPRAGYSSLEMNG